MGNLSETKLNYEFFPCENVIQYSVTRLVRDRRKYIEVSNVSFKFLLLPSGEKCGKIIFKYERRNYRLCIMKRRYWSCFPETVEWNSF